MNWNYRLLQNLDSDEGQYSLVEVFYKDGSPVGYTNAHLSDWESVEDIHFTLHKMKDALDKPVIVFKDDNFVENV